MDLSRAVGLAAFPLWILELPPQLWLFLDSAHELCCLESRSSELVCRWRVYRMGARECARSTYLLRRRMHDHGKGDNFAEWGTR